MKTTCIFLGVLKTPSTYTRSPIKNNINSKNRAADTYPLLSFFLSIFMCRNPDWTLRLSCWHWVLTYGSRRCRDAVRLLGNVITPVHWGWWTIFKEHFPFSDAVCCTQTIMSDLGFGGRNSGFYGCRILVGMGVNLDPDLTFTNPRDGVIMFRCSSI